MLHSQRLSALPLSIQEEIRTALKPNILAFAKVTGAMDSDADFRFEKIKLDALLVAKTGGSSELYVVHWGLPLFGVNGGVWIAEVNASGARNLVDPQRETEGVGSFSGWGCK